MEYATPSDPALQAVAWVAGSLFMASLLCLLLSLLLRFFRLRREARAQRVEAIWRPLCFAAMVNDLPADLPELSRRDAGILTDIWLDCLDRIRGQESTRGLIVLAGRLRLHRHLLPSLKSGRTDQRLQALLALGALQDNRALPLAEAMLDSPYPLMSLAAAKALLEIDPHNATPMVMARLDTPGWPVGRISQLLRLAPLKLVRQAVADALRHWPAEHMGKLLMVVHALADSEFHQAARLVLQRFPENTALLALILQLDDDPAIHALASRLSTHHDNGLRLAALEALGRIGSLADEQRLLHSLRQDDWPHQQVAARALAGLPGMSRAQAQALLAELPPGSSRLHWQEALHGKGWLPENADLELPAHA